MNELPDEDPKLLNFLRQNRSIALLESLELEDRLMAEIDFIHRCTPQAAHISSVNTHKYLVVITSCLWLALANIARAQPVNPKVIHLLNRLSLGIR